MAKERCMWLEPAERAALDDDGLLAWFKQEGFDLTNPEHFPIRQVVDADGWIWYYQALPEPPAAEVPAPDDPAVAAKLAQYGIK